MEQTTLNTFFAVRKRSGADLGRKRKRTESSREGESSSVPKSCSKAEDRMVCLGEKKAGKRVVTPTTMLSPLRTGSRGMAMLRLAQQTPQPQPSSKSDSPQLQRFQAVEFVSPKKSTAIRQLDFEQSGLHSPDSLSHKRLQRKYMKFRELAASPSETANSFESSLGGDPAQGKHHGTLTHTSTASPSADLPLPSGYKLIQEMFQSTDVVVSMMQGRGEICTYAKLKQAVERMTRRTFEMKHLGQIKTIYPEAFIFRQEKNIPGTYGLKQYQQYQLTVEATSHIGQARQDIAESSSSVKGLLPQVLVGRRRHFHKNLLQVVVEHHKKFLASRVPPLEVPVDQLFRWDKEFTLNSVPDVEECSLPVPPTLDRCMSAGQVLEATKIKVTGRMKKALESVALEKEANREKEVKEEGSSSACDSRIASPTVDPLFKGVSPALLERVQAKEAARAKASMTRNPQQEKELGILMRLPEFCRILRSLFVTEKKAALEWEYVVQKLMDSHSSSLSDVQVDEHLDVLAQAVPKWAQKITVRKRTYLKIDKNKDLSSVTTQLQNKVKTLQMS